MDNPTPRRVVGIDPGAAGAAALLVDGVAAAVCDMPTVMVGKTRPRRQVHGGTLTETLRLWRPHVVFVEQVASRPGQGVASMFSFGDTYGAARTAAESSTYNVRLTPPQTWKAALGLLGTDKDAARALASEVFPEVAEWLAWKKDQGRADALLLAHYGASLMVDEAAGRARPPDPPAIRFNLATAGLAPSAE